MVGIGMSGIETEEDLAAESLVLARFFPYRLSLLQLAVSRALAQVYAQPFGLHRHAWRVMAVLGGEAPLSAAEVAARTSMDKVQVSRALARLGADGWLERRADPGDRRRSRLALSPAGRAVYREIVPRVRARERQLLEALDAGERAALEEVMERLTRRARELIESSPK